MWVPRKTPGQESHCHLCSERSRHFNTVADAFNWLRPVYEASEWKNPCNSFQVNMTIFVGKNGFCPSVYAQSGSQGPYVLLHGYKKSYYYWVDTGVIEDLGDSDSDEDLFSQW